MKSMTEPAGGELCLPQRPTTKWERLEEEEGWINTATIYVYTVKIPGISSNTYNS